MKYYNLKSPESAIRFSVGRSPTKMKTKMKTKTKTKTKIKKKIKTKTKTKTKIKKKIKIKTKMKMKMKKVFSFLHFFISSLKNFKFPLFLKHFAVITIVIDELFVRSLFNNFAVIENNNFIERQQPINTVRDNDRSFIS